MNDPGRIAVQFGSLQQAKTDVDSVHKRLMGVMESVNDTVSSLKSSWDGGGAEAYQWAQSDWDAIFAEHIATLLAIGNCVDMAYGNYKRTEDHITASWQR